VYDAAMKSLIALLLLIAVAASAAQTGNWNIPKEFTADDVGYKGDMAQLHGNVIFHREQGSLFSQDMEIRRGSSGIWVHGDSRVEVVDVKPNPEFRNIPLSKSLFSADEVRQEGDLAIFHGHVKMEIRPATLAIQAADDAVLNTVTGSITVKGDATYIRMKGNGCSVDIWTGNPYHSPCRSSVLPLPR
jgi:hypothetical protein